MVCGLINCEEYVSHVLRRSRRLATWSGKIRPIGGGRRGCRPCLLCGVAAAYTTPVSALASRTRRIVIRDTSQDEISYHSWRKRHFVLLPRIVKWLTWNHNVCVEIMYEIWKAVKEMVFPVCLFNLEPPIIASTRANYGCMQCCHTINSSCFPLGTTEISARLDRREWWILSRVYGSVTNNNGFWIGWLGLLTSSFTISLNNNQL
jgi:hypothetical protein